MIFRYFENTAIFSHFYSTFNHSKSFVYTFQFLPQFEIQGGKFKIIHSHKFVFLAAKFKSEAGNLKSLVEIYLNFRGEIRKYSFKSI